MVESAGGWGETIRRYWMEGFAVRRSSAAWSAPAWRPIPGSRFGDCRAGPLLRADPVPGRSPDQGLLNYTSSQAQGMVESTMSASGRFRRSPVLRQAGLRDSRYAGDQKWWV